MDRFDTGVPLTFGKDLGDGHPLGGYLVTTAPQLLDDGIESVRVIRHCKPFGFN
jgi:hypothetical protein